MSGMTKNSIKERGEINDSRETQLFKQEVGRKSFQLENKFTAIQYQFLEAFQIRKRSIHQIVIVINDSSNSKFSKTTAKFRAALQAVFIFEGNKNIA